MLVREDLRGQIQISDKGVSAKVGETANWNPLPLGKS